MRIGSIMFIAGIVGIAAAGFGQATGGDSGYKVVQSVKVGGEGNFDYVFADADSRHLFVPRMGRGRATPGRVSAYDLDTLKLVGEVTEVNQGHGVAVDTKTGHAFVSSNPVIMFDSKTLEKIKSIDVQGRPDGIFFEPFTDRIYVLSHSAPNVTVINPADGTIAGTIDLGGGPEQGVSDGKGHVYIDIEDQNNVAVVDPTAMTCTGHYDLQGKGAGPGGLAMDTANGILFSYCHDPAVCVILNAADGKILATLPTGRGVDAAEFNQNTLESFSSEGQDGTLTVIKENSPTDFVVEQTVKTKAGAKCSTLDSKTQQIYLITADRAAAAPPPTQPAGEAAGGGGGGGGGGGRRGRGGAMVPGSFTILVVGK